MGFLDNLVKKKSPVEKAQKELTEPYAQPDVRRTAMNKLLEIGTEEAFDALLKRFTFAASGNIADEEEKRELVEELARVGHLAVPALKRFITAEKQIGFPLTALAKILSKDEVISFVVETLKKKEPLDHRSTESKRSLLLALADRGGPELADVIAPYLDDHHDDVQFHALEALERFKNDSMAPKISAVCLGESHSARIQRRAAQVLAALEWPATDFDGWNSDLKGEYLLTKKSVPVKKTTSRAS